VSWGLLANEEIKVIYAVKIYWWLIVFPSLALGNHAVRVETSSATACAMRSTRSSRPVDRRCRKGERGRRGDWEMGRLECGPVSSALRNSVAFGKYNRTATTTSSSIAWIGYEEAAQKIDCRGVGPLKGK